MIELSPQQHLFSMSPINQHFSGVSKNNQFKQNPVLGPYAKKKRLLILMALNTEGNKGKKNTQRGGLYSGIPVT